MKKYTFRLLAVTALLALLVCSSVSAAPVQSVQGRSAIETINCYSNYPDTNYTVATQKTLYSMTGSADYTLYVLEPYGFAILLNESNELMEACYAENVVSPIPANDARTYYYGGPGVYCVTQNGAMYNTFDNTALTTGEVQAIVQAEAAAQAYVLEKTQTEKQAVARGAAAASTTLSHSVAYSYFSNLTEFGDNENDTCTVIAVQMLLGYYDTYANDAVVDAVYEDNGGTTEAFHQVLNGYVYGTSEQDGIYIHDAADGIDDYLDDRGLNCNLLSEYSSRTAAIQTIINKLQSGQPVVASMGHNKPTVPYEHSVLVYSVTYDSTDPTNTAVLTMNMGWHQEMSDGQYCTEYVASAGWFYECGYIANNCASHSMSMWTNYNAAEHHRYCTNCTHFELQYHYLSWNTLLQKCNVCGRRGNYIMPGA